MGLASGDLDGAKEAGRPERNAGEPVKDVRDGLDAGRIGRCPALDAGFRPGEALEGTFRAAILVGLASRDAGGPSSITQLALISAPFSV